MKIIVLVFLVAFMFFQLKQPSISSKKFDDVANKTIKKMDTSEMEAQDNLSIKRFLGVDPGEYDGILYYKDVDALKATEIVVVKFNSTSQGAAFEKAMNQRIVNQRNVFDGYIEDQSKLLKAAVIDVQANYAIYIVSPNAKDVHQVFKKAL